MLCYRWESELLTTLPIGSSLKVGELRVTPKKNWFHKCIVSNTKNFYDPDNNRYVNYKDVLNNRNISPDIRYKLKKYLDQSIKQKLIEDIFEKVRAQKFRHRPSRLKCIYAAKNESEARSWEKKLPLSKGLRHILCEIELTSEFFFTSDAPLWGCEELSNIQIEQRAIQYWSGITDTSSSEGNEILYEGAYIIKKIIE